MHFKVGDIVYFTGFKHIRPYIGEVCLSDKNSVNLQIITIESGELRISKGSGLTFNQKGEMFNFEEYGKFLFRLNRNEWHFLD